MPWRSEPALSQASTSVGWHACQLLHPPASNLTGWHFHQLGNHLPSIRHAPSTPPFLLPGLLTCAPPRFSMPLSTAVRAVESSARSRKMRSLRRSWRGECTSDGRSSRRLSSRPWGGGEGRKRERGRGQQRGRHGYVQQAATHTSGHRGFSTLVSHDPPTVALLPVSCTESRPHLSVALRWCSANPAFSSLCVRRSCAYVCAYETHSMSGGLVFGFRVYGFRVLGCRMRVRSPPAGQPRSCPPRGPTQS